MQLRNAPFAVLRPSPLILAASIVLAALVILSPARVSATDDPLPSPLFDQSLQTSVSKMATSTETGTGKSEGPGAPEKANAFDRTKLYPSATITLSGYVTCAEPTCPGFHTCQGAFTCGATCSLSPTCGGSTTCSQYSTCNGGATCGGNPTCPGASTCCGSGPTCVDETPPLLSCPDRITVYVDGEFFSGYGCGALVGYSHLITASDECGISNFTLDPPESEYPSSAYFPIGVTPVVCTVTDNAGNTSQCVFYVEVLPYRPILTCPAETAAVLLGHSVDVHGTATSDYGNIPEVEFNLESFINLSDPGRVPHHSPTISSYHDYFLQEAVWTLSWQTESLDNNDAGLWEACVTVTDPCGAEDTCCLLIDARPFTVCLGPPGSIDDHNVHVLNGQDATLYVKLSHGAPVGGLDLLVCYDQSGLAFFGAEAVGPLTEWEYFTYRQGANSNCSGGCPSGLVRIVAIADLDNGPDEHPGESAYRLDGEIASLSFHVTSDRNFIGQCLPVGFCAWDCGDNALSNTGGDSLFLAQDADSVCLAGAKAEAFPIIAFCDGAICIDEPPDDRGDINLNGIANEVSDAVLFSKYFVYGVTVFDDIFKDAQILATDVNDDGAVLTIADLIYLIRVITGDEQPFPADPGSPKLTPDQTKATIQAATQSGRVVVTLDSPVNVAGAVLVFHYNQLEIGTPDASSAAAGLMVESRTDNGELRILMRPPLDRSAPPVAAGTNTLLTIPFGGTGHIELTDAQLSDDSGRLLDVRLPNMSAQPRSYRLSQNYPNPFNAGTVIPFVLEEGGDWTLTIFNVTGQVVRTFTGNDAAGEVRITWTGLDERGDRASSGVYLYRVSSGQFTASRKMMLLK